jgi:CheY-like chemotaxis protein
VFITARIDAPSRTRALAEGAVAYLAKPFTPTALLEALEVAIPREE